jgi:ferredoxin
VDRKKCAGCGTCLDICPVEAIKIVDNVAQISEADCAECGTCVDECPEKALTLPS